MSAVTEYWNLFYVVLVNMPPHSLWVSALFGAVLVGFYLATLDHFGSHFMALFLNVIIFAFGHGMLNRYFFGVSPYDGRIFTMKVGGDVVFALFIALGAAAAILVLLRVFRNFEPPQTT